MSSTVVHHVWRSIGNWSNMLKSSVVITRNSSGPSFWSEEIVVFRKTNSFIRRSFRFIWIWTLNTKQVSVTRSMVDPSFQAVVFDTWTHAQGKTGINVTDTYTRKNDWNVTSLCPACLAFGVGFRCRRQSPELIDPSGIRFVFTLRQVTQTVLAGSVQSGWLDC